MHKLFAKQLAKARAPAGVDLDRLGELVSAAYDEADRDRRLTDRSIGLMIEELEQRHRALTASEERLRAQNLRFDAALNNMSQGLCMFDAEFRVVVHNRRCLDMFGLAPEMIEPGTALLDVFRRMVARGGVADRTAEQLYADYRAQIAARGAAMYHRELPGGRVVAIVHRAMADGGWVATYEDVTERRRAEARIAYLAAHDALTGLSNRAAFSEHLAFALDGAADGGEAVAVLCVDLDRFKEVNDVFGHTVGDGLLKHVARRLEAAADGAFVARVGGDEFTIVSSGRPQPETAAALADRLLAAVAQDIDVDGHRLRAGLSVGVAIYPTDGDDATTLLANADAALYRAKAEGRGAMRFFEPDMDLRLRQKRALQSDLQSALARGQLAVHFQPQARIDREVVGFEALVRWTHQDLGPVAPATFIPLAEESGAIMPIGEWVLREVCREAASWPRPLQVAVNLSPVQFRHGDLPGVVHAALLDSGLAPGRLELEITEGVLIDDFSRTVSILRRLKALGVRIAMDDFGTGYSSLSYLRSFPFDKIKIDRAFIASMEHNPQSAAIVRAVIGLGRGLDLPVVAEGVESDSEIAFLAREDCHEVQGYLIGRPRPIDDYATLVGRPAAAQARTA